MSPSVFSGGGVTGFSLKCALSPDIFCENGDKDASKRTQFFADIVAFSERDQHDVAGTAAEPKGMRQWLACLGQIPLTCLCM